MFNYFQIIPRVLGRRGRDKELGEAGGWDKPVNIMDLVKIP